MLFERFADAKVRGDNNDLLMIGKELRNNVGEVAKLRGLYAPVRPEVDVNIHQTAAAILDRAEQDLLALVAERQRQNMGTAPSVMTGGAESVFGVFPRPTDSGPNVLSGTNTESPSLPRP